LPTYLEGDGEVSEALSEDPDDGVAEPDNDGEARSPAVDGAGVAALSLSGLRPGLAESEDDVHEPAHAEEPPHPLDVAHSQGAESAACNHENCGNTFGQPGASGALLYFRRKKTSQFQQKFAETFFVVTHIHVHLVYAHTRG
jgi:hypothetical protein